MLSKLDLGNSMLHDAVEQGDTEEIKKLRRQGVDTTAQNAEGKRARDLATSAVIALLADGIIVDEEPAQGFSLDTLASPSSFDGPQLPPAPKPQPYSSAPTYQMKKKA